MKRRRAACHLLLYLILTHPNVRRKFMAELHSVLGQAPPGYVAVEKQTYLRQVVYETLRLVPPVSIFVREALEEVELPTFVLPKGATVMLSPYVVHRQAELWMDPERFEPERFDSERRMESPIFFLRRRSQDMRRRSIRHQCNDARFNRPVPKLGFRTGYITPGGAVLQWNVAAKSDASPRSSMVRAATAPRVSRSTPCRRHDQTLALAIVIRKSSSRDTGG
jgi:hypothetical protein